MTLADDLRALSPDTIHGLPGMGCVSAIQKASVAGLEREAMEPR
jgi:hypothetical protein